VRVRNLHTADVGTIPPGEIGELPRSRPVKQLIAVGILEEAPAELELEDGDTPDSSPPVREAGDSSTPEPPWKPPGVEVSSPAAGPGGRGTPLEGNSTPDPEAGENSTPDPDESPANLDGHNAKEARRLVNHTSDPALLVRWNVSEERKTVRAAIEARLEVLGDGDSR
jgi:hypothetical protein